MMRPVDARDLEAGQGRAVERGMREILRHAVAANGIGNAETPHELHRARIECGGAGVIRRTFALFDHEAGHAAAAEIGGERKPHGAGAHDQDRRFSDGHDSII